MINPRLIPWLALAALAVAGIAGWRGYAMGYAASEADQNAELLARIEAGQKLDADRIRIARERDNLARQLEEQANADPVVVERCLGPGRVRRLDALR